MIYTMNLGRINLSEMLSSTTKGTYKVINDNLLPNYFLALEKLKRDVPGLKDYKFELILGFNTSDWMGWTFVANSYLSFEYGVTECLSTRIENEDLYELISEHIKDLTGSEHKLYSLELTLNKLIEETTRPDEPDNQYIAWIVREVLKNSNVDYEDFVINYDIEELVNDELVETLGSIIGIDIDSLGSYLSDYFSSFNNKYNLTG